MKKSLVRHLGVAAMLAVASVTGCKAKEAPDSGFLSDTQKMSRKKDTPFHRTYWNQRFNIKNYDEVMIAPVNTNYVMAQGVWEKASLASISQDQLRKDINELAAYTRQSFVRGFNDDPNKRMKVVDKAGPRTLILETALIQVVPSKAAMNAIGYVTWVPAAVSVAGSVATDSEDVGKGVVAIEGRIRDGRTGEVIGMFADREIPKTALLDLKALNWWAPAKGIVDDWAQQLVILANKGPGTKLEDSKSFQIIVF